MILPLFPHVQNVVPFVPATLSTLYPMIEVVVVVVSTLPAPSTRATTRVVDFEYGYDVPGG